jgi:hypothetical protein
MASAERRPQCAAERPHISAPYLHQEGVCGGRGGVGPLRAILVKLGEAGISDEDIPKHPMKRPTNCSSFAGTLRG